ncbi:hypothetical protein Hanom_Chr07g00648021 [Helianthus anomalus]
MIRERFPEVVFCVFWWRCYWLWGCYRWRAGRGVLLKIVVACLWCCSSFYFSPIEPTFDRGYFFPECNRDVSVAVKHVML